MSSKVKDSLASHGQVSNEAAPEPKKRQVQRIETVTHEAIDVKEESNFGESLSKHKYIILAVGLLLGVAAYAAVHYHLLGHLKWFGVTAGATFLACGILGLWIAHKPKNPNENRFATPVDHLDPQPEQQETALSRSKKALISFVVLSVLFGMTVLAFKFIPKAHIFDPNMGIGLAGASVGLCFAMIASYIYYQYQEKEDYEFQGKAPTTAPSTLSQEEFDRRLESHAHPETDWLTPGAKQWRRAPRNPDNWVVHVPTGSDQLVPASPANR